MLCCNLGVLTVLGHVLLTRKLLSLSSGSQQIFLSGVRYA